MQRRLLKWSGALNNRRNAGNLMRSIFASPALFSTAKAERKVMPRKRSQSPLKTSPTRARGRNSLNQVVINVEALVQESKRDGKSFQPCMDYLRRVSSVLQLCKTREQCTAAIPLCHIVQRAQFIHGMAEMECLRIYQKAGRNKEVITLAEILMNRDVFLLNSALSSVIQACAALEDIDKGFQIFNAAVRRGSIPNARVFSALLAVAGASKDPQRVQNVLTKMQDVGIEMNDITYHNLMSAYARGGHVTEALALFDKMQKQGIAADGHTYAILMDVHAASGDFDGTLALMNELKTTAIQLNLVHYNVMLKACGKTSNLAVAFQMYEELKDRKIKPDLVTFITMMHAVYHGEIGAIDQKKVKTILVGMAMMGMSFVPFINYEEYMMTTLFCGSLVGSMGLAAYMNPDGVLRALYPNTDELRNDTVIEAFFRRLREEDHCGRSIYLWREMIKYNVPADPRVYDILVRTCVRKRHPELAYEAVLEEKLPLVDREGRFVLSLHTTLSLLQSLLAQRRENMANTLYDAARSHNVFDTVFDEKSRVYVYDMRPFLSEQLRSYIIIKLMDELRSKTDLSKGEVPIPSVQFLIYHGYELLDRLDADNASLRTLFSMDDMTRVDAEKHSATSGRYYFWIAIPSERLQTYFENTPINAGKEHRL